MVLGARCWRERTRKGPRMSGKPVSIVGSDHTPFGRLDSLTLERLIVMAVTAAMLQTVRV